MCKVSVNLSPPTNQHPIFYEPDALPVAQPTVSKHRRENLLYLTVTTEYLYNCRCNHSRHCTYPLFLLGGRGLGLVLLYDFLHFLRKFVLAAFFSLSACAVHIALCIGNCTRHCPLLVFFKIFPQLQTRAVDDLIFFKQLTRAERMTN